jgi:hypothetical protein
MASFTIVELTGGAAAVEDQFGSFRQAIEELLAGVSAADRRTVERVLSGLAAKIHQGDVD